MRQNNILALLILILCCSSCKRYEKLPLYDDVNSSPYGSLAILKCKRVTYKGELIARKNDDLYLLSADNDNRLLKLSIHDILSYKLKFAKSKKNYKEWMALGLTSLTHGWFGFITIIPNLVVPSSMAKAEEKDYSIRHSIDDPLPMDEFHFDIINRFCRYPQGIPAGVDLLDISLVE